MGDWNDYYRGYNGYNNKNKKKRRYVSDIDLFKNNTEQTKKSYMMGYIYNALEDGAIPQMTTIQVRPNEYRIFYYLCDLPLKCFAIYFEGKTYVCEGRTGNGTLNFMRGVLYQHGGGDFLMSHEFGTRMWEDAFCDYVTRIVQTFFPSAIISKESGK